jgi:hypothetical protein
MTMRCAGVITLHTKIKGRFKSVDEDGNPVSRDL